ncbi:lipoyl synthase, partial [Candidatus Aerophobetes bacterium]|nr:lipoyl synthase [Candidatus Aerophobetes bacterium]
MRFPEWLKKRLPASEAIDEVHKILERHHLHTVCQEAKCPNMGECFSRKTATFMILGDICTRSCRFCAVKKGVPFPPDPQEPENVAQAVAELGLSYVVITSVTRDDLPDGGAGQFAQTINAIKRLCGEKTLVEVLVPDFKGNFFSLEKVLEAYPFVLNHNLETVPRLYKEVRPQADYYRSLGLLKKCKELLPHIYTKSGLMVGLGEKKEEVIEVMKDLRDAGCDILTIGQYLRPSPEQLEVKEFVPPEVFSYYREIAQNL